MKTFTCLYFHIMDATREFKLMINFICPSMSVIRIIDCIHYSLYVFNMIPINPHFCFNRMFKFSSLTWLSSLKQARLFMHESSNVIVYINSLTSLNALFLDLDVILHFSLMKHDLTHRFDSVRDRLDQV